MSQKLVCILTIAFAYSNANAGNCLVQGEQKIRDCGNVNVGSARPLTVTRSETFSGNYGDVLVKAGAVASINGNTSNVMVEKGARLYFSGNADHIRIFGVAEIDGNTKSVTAELGSEVRIRGIVTNLFGGGKVIKSKGVIVGGGVYVR